MADRPIVIVTRKLPDVVETRLRELFDARLNLEDRPFTREDAAAERVYATLPDLNFSELVLAPAAARLGVLRVKELEWSDWGNTDRVFTTMRRTGWRPRWLDSLAPAGGFD